MQQMQHSHCWHRPPATMAELSCIMDCCPAQLSNPFPSTCASAQSKQWVAAASTPQLAHPPQKLQMSQLTLHGHSTATPSAMVSSSSNTRAPAFHWLQLRCAVKTSPPQHTDKAVRPSLTPVPCDDDKTMQRARQLASRWSRLSNTPCCIIIPQPPFIIEGCRKHELHSTTLQTPPFNATLNQAYVIGTGPQCRQAAGGAATCNCCGSKPLLNS
ncbi:hypothetical protein COO60DRAFT_139721 [Scenedesmus sp. NREL 46B-D3]|nr:hypothetical protein COO60DRAFT_139721 [Scenedesmus sp. NREL 46B-D3]